MRLLPRSLFGRLLGIAALSTLGALLFAAFSISHVLERFVMRALDDRLDAQVMVLAQAVRTDGSLDPARAVDLPEFGNAGSGWIWQVDAPGGRRWSSPGGEIVISLPPRGPRPDPMPDAHQVQPQAGEGIGPSGARLHFRRLEVATPAGPVLVTASGPRRIVEAPLREAMLPLLLSLALLGAGLALATLVQLRVGLRPLRRLSTAVAEVRSGLRKHVPLEQPHELAPLASELNALIDHNEAALAHARLHVANLAHGLKTPLAALGLKLSEPGSDPDGTLADMLAQLDRRIRHHLGRARAAAPGGAGRARTPLAPAISDLVEVLRRIHSDSGVAASSEVQADIDVAIDPQDLDEMIGNLLDNAWRHARTLVRVSASRSDGSVTIAIEDDGPGLSDVSMREALIPGRRLDEGSDGYGFGLSIAHELAELNGGRLALLRSPSGGLDARLTLPLQAPG